MTTTTRAPGAASPAAAAAASPAAARAHRPARAAAAAHGPAPNLAALRAALDAQRRPAGRGAEGPGQAARRAVCSKVERPWQQPRIRAARRPRTRPR